MEFGADPLIGSRDTVQIRKYHVDAKTDANANEIHAKTLCNHVTKGGDRKNVFYRRTFLVVS